MSASFGSLPVICWLVEARIPLPASGNHCESLPVCVPYVACEKLASFARFVPRLATQPIMGMVTSACAPAALVLEMNVSPTSPATELGYPILSKYQSASLLSALRSQL